MNGDVCLLENYIYSSKDQKGRTSPLGQDLYSLLWISIMVSLMMHEQYVPNVERDTRFIPIAFSRGHIRKTKIIIPILLKRLLYLTTCC